MNLKMLYTSTFISLLFSSCLFWGNCEDGEGPLVEKKIKVEKFNQLTLSGSHLVYLSQGETQEVSIKAQENIIQLLNTTAEGGKWIIDFEKCIKVKEKVEFYVTVTDLKEIEIDGSGSIIGRTTLTADELELEVNGSGEIVIDLAEVKELESEINGSGDLNLSGNAKDHEMEINGSGDIKAFDLKTDKSSIEINGSGDVDVNVSFELKAEINGSGDVSYKGDVKNINTEVNGSGDINQVK
jgi:hypothetical protein